MASQLKQYKKSVYVRKLFDAIPITDDHPLLKEAFYTCLYRLKNRQTAYKKHHNKGMTEGEANELAANVFKEVAEQLPTKAHAIHLGKMLGIFPSEDITEPGSEHSS